jgi:6-phosphogluconolactonase (cycloisomerase 2 family)
LSGYAIDFDGPIELLDADGCTREPGPGTRPLDMDLSDDGRFLFTLNIGDGTISTFAVLHDGSLDHLDVVDGVPVGVNGLAAR